MGLVCTSFVFNSQAQTNDSGDVKLRYNFKDNPNPKFDTETEAKPSLFLNDPSNVKSKGEYDPETGQYQFKQEFEEGGNYKPPTYMDLDEFQGFDFDKGQRDYWKEKQATEKEFNDETKGAGFRPQIKVNSEAFDRIFGGNTIDIRPAGSAEIIFGVNSSKTENPAIPERQRKITNFNFDQRIQLNIIGNIGEKVKLSTQYNTEATFEFENQMKLEYTGLEDEILQKIEMGNVTLPLNSQLIRGAQSLFGLKTETKFGRLTMTTVFSQQRGQRREITTQGGAQVREFEVPVDNYDFNRHFFLSHFFRDNYETAVGTPPLLNTAVNITRIEVWVTNTRNVTTDTRNVIAFQDLGEGNSANFYNPNFVTDLDPRSDLAGDIINGNYQANDLYQKIRNLPDIRNFIRTTNVLNAQGLAPGADYQKVELARKLTETEYTLEPQLGFISLNIQLNPNQVLAVAFQYTYLGQTYQVGEFSTDGVDGTQPLIMKMLKSTELNTRIPMWDLMMKNVYSLGAFNVKKENFELQVWYLDQNTGLEINYLPAGRIKDQPLIQPLGLDRLTINGQPNPDGVFDFIDNPIITINPRTGRVYFPSLEPFGSNLRRAIGDDEIAEQFTFDSLYTNTQAEAKFGFPEKNRFLIKGFYESSNSSEIALDAINVPEGSVTVLAGGRQLVENQDYTVDYTLGRVKIINQGVLESGTPIKVSLESQDMFSIQQKTLVANRFDYKFSDDLRVGGTIMNLSERPLTQKVNIGNEPMRNTMWGIDANYQTESRFLTSLIDKLPFYNTKAISSITASGEFAQLLPGHSRAIGKEGNSYIDDFEGSQSFIDLRQMQNWSIASTPQFQPNIFPEARFTGDLRFNMNRSKFAWYTVDPMFYRTQNQGLMPEHILADEAMRSNHFMREIFETEVFPNRDIPVGQPTNIPVLDIAFYPNERGPYNYDLSEFGENGVSAGMNPDGSLKNPSSRWGGMMRPINQNDFEAANIEFIQFWVMDPFNEDYPHDDNNSGFLYFNLGNISEDVLNDGLKSFENGLPTNLQSSQDLSGDTISPWGRIPMGQQLVQAFDNDVTTREFQDVGLDGLRDQEERIFFDEYVDQARQFLNPDAFQTVFDDPSADNYNYYRDDQFDAEERNVKERYKFFNGLEGNSPTNEQSQTLNADGFPTTASPRPNAEDINQDNTLDDIEGYFQYRIPVNKNTFDPSSVGSNFMTDFVEANVTTANGQQRTVRWYQFKIPIRTDQSQKFGNITDFRSIRFMRMFMQGFNDPVYLRFARLELIRGEWRRYLGRLDDRNEGFADDQVSRFNIAAVNIEENGNKTPVNYTLPPDIEREINLNTTNLQRLNEQSLSLEVCDLPDGLAHAAFRNMELDVLNFGKLQMYVHAEQGRDESALNDGDITVFIRLGTDFEDNYYEYEIPVRITPPGFYNPDTREGRAQVWPLENNIEIDFDELRSKKLLRNREVLAGDATNQQRRGYPMGNGTVYIVGNPNLRTVKNIMIGVRNPVRSPERPNDDGLPKCAEVWVNELRLTHFDKNNGWATTGRVTAKLADLGNVTLAGGMSTPGFGGIEDRVSERQRETNQFVDASASIELGKFLPENSGIRIPMFVNYSENITRPQFSPLDTDIPFNDYSEEVFDSRARQDSVKRITETRTIRRSINFTNVRKEKTGDGISTPLDISNFDFSYSYSEQFMRSFNVERDIRRNYRVGIGYAFAPKPNNIKPLENVGFLKKSKYLQIIRDFNFYLAPRQVTFRNDFNRMYQEQLNRNNNPGITADLPPFMNRQFNWTRNFAMQYDITRALKLNFSSNSNNLVQEIDSVLTGPDERRPLRVIHKERDALGYEQWRSALWDSIASLGTIMNYTHQANLDYQLPLNKIPFLDWINSNARYSAGYTWQRAPLAAPFLGHTIQNTQQISLNATANMTQLYRKVGYFKKIEQKARRAGNTNLNQRQQRAARNVRQEETGEKEKDDKKLKVHEHAIRLMLSLKNVNVSVTQNSGLLMPGFNQEPLFVGMNSNFAAPGWGFIMGQQRGFGSADTFAVYAADRRWLVDTNNVNVNVVHTFNRNANLRASLQPINDLRIDLTATYQNSLNTNYFYRYQDTIRNPDRTSTDYATESFMESGNLSLSFNSLFSAFEPLNSSEEYRSATYERFLELRSDISKELSDRNPASNGFFQPDSGVISQNYFDGYGPTSQDVLIPAFIQAYSGTPTNINIFKVLPQINWRVTYTGLSKIPALQDLFESVTLNHSYRSTLNFGNYMTNLLHEPVSRNNDFPGTKDQAGNFISRYQMNTVTISEQFAPLINFDMKWKSSLLTRIEFRRDRTLSLSMANTQITEMRGMEYTFGLGYVFKNVEIPIQVQNKNLKSDLNVRADVSLRNNTTLIRQITEGTNIPTAGQNVVTIRINADYRVSRQLNVRAFYDRTVNNPVISIAFPTANTAAGISLRFTLS